MLDYSYAVAYVAFKLSAFIPNQFLGKPATDILHTTRHMDERISEGKISEGDPITLNISEDDDGIVKVSKDKVQFEEVATVLRKM